MAVAIYSKAPITEAVIDLRVKLPDEVKVEQLERLQTAEEANYPEKKPISIVTTEIRAGGEFTSDVKKHHKGWGFVSADKKQVWQVHVDGFSFSRLAPYDRWETFRDEARRLWNIYRSELNPTTVVRIALRYINRLDLPTPLRDFKDYLKTVPEVAPGLPQGLAGFLMQLQIPQEDVKAMLVLNEALASSSSANVASVILDLDLFRAEDLPSADDSIWSLFETLRVKKDEIFESCITDAMRDIIR